ncbi:hypothetical protein E4U55_003703 [Claviceps digitariae]|nr:hypothetical protein E4U55_003703 [Claviceps digitariae]
MPFTIDVVGFAVALVALMISERTEPPPQEYTFGWQRATLLGAFFNGVFLLALGISILEQAISRFADSPQIDQPEIVFIIGCVGLGLNLLVMSFLHGQSVLAVPIGSPEDMLTKRQEHDHDTEHVHGHSQSLTNPHRGHIHDDGLHWDNEGRLPFPDANQGHVEAVKNFVRCATHCLILLLLKELSSQALLQTTVCHYGHKHAAVTPTKPGKDLGLLGIFVHVVGDAINNVGVVISALIIWLTDSPMRYYADPAISVFIAIMIFLTALPLTKRSGRILLQIAPVGLDMEHVKHDIEMIDGVQSVHELHIWRLTQQKTIATAHIVIDDGTIRNFAQTAKIIMQCLHAYGIHSATLQPEAVPPVAVSHLETASTNSDTATIREGRINRSACQLLCSSVCSDLTCCT